MTPWIIHEAEIALYPAWKDGMPFLGPGLERGHPLPLLRCKSSLSVTESTRAAARTGHSWTGAEPVVESEWQISISFPDASFGDQVSRVMSRVAVGGLHILVVNFRDEITQQWSCFQWFYVTLEADELGDSGEVMSRSVRLRSSWLQESVGSGAAPSMLPVIYGEVDWVCGPRRVTGMRYDPALEQWISMPQNEVGDGTRYVNIAPVSDSSDEVAVSAYFPRVVMGPQSPPALPVAVVNWQNIVLARIGGPDSSFLHGLALLGMVLQAGGIVEPLLADAQERMLDEPVVVFRYLRRVYATFGHGVLAVPQLVENEAPPFSHDLPFRLAVPGGANPATGMSGLVLLPGGAWLDGVVGSIF